MRRETIVQCTRPGRDEGRRYQLTEMSALQGERWALRAFNLIQRYDPLMADEIEEIKGGGFAAFTGRFLEAFAKVPFTEIEPLLMDMFVCVKSVNGQDDKMHVRALLPDDIEEITTRLWLRMEVLKLHMDFTAAVSR